MLIIHMNIIVEEQNIYVIRGDRSYNKVWHVLNVLLIAIQLPNNEIGSVHV